MDSRVIIFAFMLVALNTTANAESAQYATRTQVNISQITQNSATKNTIKKSSTNAKSVTRTNIKTQTTKYKSQKYSQNTSNTTKATPKSKKNVRQITPKTGLSKTTIITLSTLGGAALASGVGVGIYYGITSKNSNNNLSYSTINIGVVDSGFDGTKIPQANKNFYDLGVKPPALINTGHGTMVAQSIRAHNMSSNLYMYRAGCKNNDPNKVYICANETMFNALYARDAKVISSSWGSMADKDSLAISAQHFSSFYNATLYYNMAKEASSGKRIFVFSAGNENSRHANIQSSLPLIPTKLPNISNRTTWENAKKGWIAVTATNSNNILDKSYANWIGEEAKNWGIAVKPHNFELGWRGTSFSAPVVSAVVANVWNQYPWMDNHLVVQTILSTADKYTASTSGIYTDSVGDIWHKDVVTDGPNKKTGWGILNQTRALKGPARFDTRLLVPSDNGKVQIDFSHQNYGDLRHTAFSNDITGDAGLHKIGSGELILSGDNTYTGETQIDGGKIILLNALHNSKVIINENGALQTQNLSFLPDSSQPQSVILGANQNYTLTNYGRFAVLKDTNLKGDYISGGNKSTLGLDISAKLNVEGSADMSGGALAFYATSTIPSTNLQTKTLLTAQNGINNFIDSQNIAQDSSAFLQISKVKLSVNNANSLQVSYKRELTSSVVAKTMGYTPKNLQNIGAGIDSVLDNLAKSKSAESGLNSSKSSANHSADFGADSSISSANPKDLSLYTEALNLMAIPLQSVTNAISSISGEIYDSNISVLHKSQILLNRTIARRIYQISNSKSSGMWADIAYSKSTLSQNGFAEGKIHQYSAIAGIDGIYIDKDISLGLGALFSVDKAKGDFGVGGKSNILSYGVSLYALTSYQNFYILARLGVNLHDISVKRQLNFGAGANLQNKQKDLSYHGYIEAGLNFDIDIFRFTPFVAWEGDFVVRKKVQENGIDNNGSNFALTIDATKFRISSLIYGAKGFFKFDDFSLEYSALNMFAPKPNPFSSKASFMGAQSIKFTSSGIPQARNLAFVSVGASYNFNDLIVRGEYSISFNLSSYRKIEDNIINLNIRYEF